MTGSQARAWRNELFNSKGQQGPTKGHNDNLIDAFASRTAFSETARLGFVPDVQKQCLATLPQGSVGPCAVLYAPWRGLEERPWFRRSFFVAPPDITFWDKEPEMSNQPIFPRAGYVFVFGVLASFCMSSCATSQSPTTKSEASAAHRFDGDARFRLVAGPARRKPASRKPPKETAAELADEIAKTFPRERVPLIAKLGRSNDPEALDVLLKILTNVEQENIAPDLNGFFQWEQNYVETLAYAISQKGKDAVDSLAPYLDSKSRRIRWIVVNVASRIGADGIPLLELATRDASATVRIEAIKRLGKLGPQAIDALIRSFAYQPSDALGYISHNNAENALFAIGKPAIEPLKAALSDENPNIRRFAAFTLSFFGREGRAAFEPLCEMAINEDDPSMRFMPLNRHGGPTVKSYQDVNERLSRKRWSQNTAAASIVSAQLRRFGETHPIDFYCKMARDGRRRRKEKQGFSGLVPRGALNDITGKGPGKRRLLNKLAAYMVLGAGTCGALFGYEVLGGIGAMVGFVAAAALMTKFVISGRFLR